MNSANTPLLETERLILRKFTENDLEALFNIYSNEEVNTYLPWFPLTSQEEAASLFKEKYQEVYKRPYGYHYAICPKNSNLPAGYIHAGTDDSHDLGYGLLQEFWHRGFATEAARAVVARLKKDGMPYITATHDIRNPRSGGVMKQLGMRYQYSYEELWKPKNIPVTFRMYQLNLDGQEDRVYQEYWNRSSVQFQRNWYLNSQYPASSSRVPSRPGKHCGYLRIRSPFHRFSGESPAPRFFQPVRNAFQLPEYFLPLPGNPLLIRRGRNRLLPGQRHQPVRHPATVRGNRRSNTLVVFIRFRFRTDRLLLFHLSGTFRNSQVPIQEHQVPRPS